MTDTDVFHKGSDETNEAFFVRMINTIIISNQPRQVSAVRIHYDLKDLTYNDNWIAVDYVKLPNE
jgi:hypothetical protein